MGNLICFPLLSSESDKSHYYESNEILITGGQFVGLTDVKSHVYSIDKNKVNLRKDLSQQFPDISKFYYTTI